MDASFIVFSSAGDVPRDGHTMRQSHEAREAPNVLNSRFALNRDRV